MSVCLCACVPVCLCGLCLGLATVQCSGVCSRGYYCPLNSTFPCGANDVYCPAGSSTPIAALPGEYTTGDTNVTRDTAVPCPSGSYCVGGVEFLCPPGRFGCANRLSDPACNGPCNAGYFCPAGATTNQLSPCGGNASNPHAAAVYCPDASGAPVAVDVGYYSTGSAADAPHLRTGQSLCPLGAFCDDGVLVSHQRVDNCSSCILVLGVGCSHDGCPLSVYTHGCGVMLPGTVSCGSLRQQFRLDVVQLHWPVCTGL